VPTFGDRRCHVAKEVLNSLCLVDFKLNAETRADASGSGEENETNLIPY
jgi:hypothetical protein